MKGRCSPPAGTVVYLLLPRFRDLRSCRSADPATDRTVLDFEVRSGLAASRPTRLDVVVRVTPFLIRASLHPTGIRPRRGCGIPWVSLTEGRHSTPGLCNGIVQSDQWIQGDTKFLISAQSNVMISTRNLSDAYLESGGSEFRAINLMVPEMARRTP